MVRQKINAPLGKDNTKPENGIPGEFKKNGEPKPYTKARFARGCGCSPKCLNTFLVAKKKMGWAESPIYPAAYKFFEKERIFEWKEKSKPREKVGEE